MMMVMKRKEVLIGALIVLIGVAAFINFNYAQPQEAPTVAVTEEAGDVQAEPETQTSAETQEAEPVGKLGEAQLVSAQVTDYFAQARLSREQARSTTTERLNEMIANENIDPETKQQAQSDLLAIANVADKEASAENMIKAKGYADAVVYVSGQTASVTVKAQSLEEADIAKIQDIVGAQTGVSIKNIKIVEVW